jgi:hypothetical protein
VRFAFFSAQLVCFAILSVLLAGRGLELQKAAP